MSDVVKMGSENWQDAVLLVDEFFNESPLFSRLGKDVLLVISEVARTATESQRVGFIGYVKGVPAGLVLGRMVNLLFGSGCIAQDMLFYVRPKYRATMLIKRLVTAFEQWAWEDPDCKLVQLTALAAKDNDRAARLVEHFGFNSVGYVMVKERQ